ncbi:uncharacterized protein LOC113791551 [Dermatophagoides pteronyssinus]|uniref:uncharacterized protein LOC113791551 n=1 Tax=Dermatophagoides pteronyssinus TaxID=6956 RepID=UPI003F67C0BC
MASAAIAATNYNVYQQQSPDFIPNNQHNQQTGDNNSTLTFSPQQQQQNFIMIKQSNQIKCITHYHYHSNQSNNNNNSGQTISTTMPSIGSNSQTTATTIKIKNEDENDSFVNNHQNNNNYYYETQGTPSSSSSSSSWSSRSSMDGDGQFLLDDNRDYMAEINHACKMLAISADPYNWNQTDVRKWLMYQQRLHQLQSFNLVVELGFPMDGMSLCELNIQDFHQRILNSMNNNNGDGNIQTWNYAKILYQELNIWRNAITKMFEPDLAFFDSSSTSTSNMIVEQQQQQNYDQFPAIMNDNKSLMMFNTYNNRSPCSSSSPISSYCSSNYSDDCQQQMLFNYGSNNFMDGYQNDHTQSLSNTNRLLYDPSSNNSVYSNSPSSSPQRSLLSCSSPAGSISSAASSTSLANNNNYITNNHMQQQQQQFQQSSQQSVDHIIGLNQRKFPENSYTSYQQNVYGNVDHTGYQENIFSAYPQQQQIITSEYGSDDEIMSDDDPINGKCRVMISAVSSSTSSKTNSPLSTKTTTTKQSTFNGPRPHGSTTSIQLWQFLRELLSQPNQHENAIRWLERQRGVFKIEDSVRVARLWGERKNRPAMNYDKLSRSIRQYYKKGIMKKTERAQRLVYQFCQPYAL